MSALTDIIKKIVSKQMTVEQAIPAVQKVLITADPARPPGDLTYEDKEKRRMEDDNDYENTFSEITAAWIAGQLSDQDFGALRNAVTPGNKNPNGEVKDSPVPKAQEDPPKK